MDEQYVADRVQLRRLLRDHPAWPHREFAAHLGRSVGWVKKWRKRFTDRPEDEQVVFGQSRAHRQPYPSWSPAVVERILAIRDDPPENLRRTPGPLAILYYLERDPALHAAGARLPRSTRTIWRILTQAGRIAHTSAPPHEPVERPEPLTSWQMDFKDASTVPGDPEGKHQHVVEVLNVVDTGTSLLLAAQPAEDYRAETILPAVAQIVQEQGLPDAVTFDRDTRFVGSPTGRDFPAPFVRFWLCLGVTVTICPPRRPDKNAFVERYHKSYDRECLRLQRPGTLAEVRDVTATYKEHYNFERPNQARSCGNRPPRQAFPTLPARPSLPLCVDPDRWLHSIDGRHFVRKVRSDGVVFVDDHAYYLTADLAGQHVALQVDAPARAFVVLHRGRPLKVVPIKGVVNRPLTFEDFVEVLCQQARLRHAAPRALVG
jgi:hypothetical protein